MCIDRIDWTCEFPEPRQGLDRIPRLLKQDLTRQLMSPKLEDLKNNAEFVVQNDLNLLRCFKDHVISCVASKVFLLEPHV